MKSIFREGATVAAALMAVILMFSAPPLAAETLFLQFQQEIQQKSEELSGTVMGGIIGAVSSTLTLKEIDSAANSEVLAPPTSYVATAYSLRGKTASGIPVARGLIAADPRVLPLGSRVRVEAGPWSGEYLVADTGGSIRGREIDIWTPTAREALRFGRRIVKLTVLKLGPRRSGSRKR